MVVTPRTLAAWLTAACLLMPAGAVAQQPEPASRLSDAWLGTLQQDNQRMAWSHAFALERASAETLEARRQRLIAELETLIREARLSDTAELGEGLAAWQASLDSTPALPARTPGRHDLPWLGANLRQDLPLSHVILWGHCSVPDWVEIWHLGGVSRVTWQSGMKFDQALAGLPDPARYGAEQAVLITPSGEQHTRGIAAWNHQATPLTPGSRVMLQLPAEGMNSTARRVVNSRLPGYLATRLPGEECEIHGSMSQGDEVSRNE
ncbi:MAG: capsule biosynthesis GfcC family protein [Pseudomonadota bacterium]